VIPHKPKSSFSRRGAFSNGTSLIVSLFPWRFNVLIWVSENTSSSNSCILLWLRSASVIFLLVWKVPGEIYVIWLVLRFMLVISVFASKIVGGMTEIYVGESNINETLGPACAIVMREGSHF
jgi:hypothetical protein